MSEKRIPLPKGHARRQFIIHQDEIFDLLKQGCLVSQIHTIMTDSKKISMSYYTLRSYIVRYSSKMLVIRPISQQEQIHSLDQKTTSPPSNNDVPAEVDNNPEPEPTPHKEEARKLPPAPPKFGSGTINDVPAEINNNPEPEPTPRKEEVKKLPPAPHKFGSEKFSAEDVI